MHTHTYSQMKFTFPVPIISPVTRLIINLKKSQSPSTTINKDNYNLTAYWLRKHTHTHKHTPVNLCPLIQQSASAEVEQKFSQLLDHKSYLFCDLLVHSVFADPPRLWLDSLILLPVRTDSQLRYYSLRIFL